MGLRKLNFGKKRSATTQSATSATTATPQTSSKLELSPKRTPKKERTHEIFHTNEIVGETRESDLASENPVDDSACCTRSRCGWPDQIHDTFLFVGKQLYDCFGDPPNAEVKDYVVGMSEIGEEGATFDDATFCCWSGDHIVDEETKPRTTRKKKTMFL